MIRNLTINNIAVIDKSDVEFTPGFNVLTGETGAGKSIIIDSINILKGERASKTLIRAGEEKAKVTGVLTLDDDLSELLEKELDIECPDGELMISREINQDGKGSVRVNAMPVSSALLKQIGDNLINIHGQHDNTALLAKKNHIRYLDGYAGEEIKALLDKYKELHKLYCEKEEELLTIDTDEKEKARRVEMLTYQTEEIERAKLKPDEEEDLESRRNFIVNIQDISIATQSAYENIFEGGQYSKSAHDLIWDSISQLEKVEKWDENIKEIRQALTDAGYIIDDKMRELSRLTDNFSYDEGELKDIENRLDLIYNLKMKYGNSVEEILNYYERISRELAEIENSDETIKRLTRELDELYKKREKTAEELTKTRKETANKLSQAIEAELKDLEMSRVGFTVDIKPSQYGTKGADEVEFLICTNVGEGYKELSKIASGGELSRIMLAMKSALVNINSADTLIFDEIDSGVSGKAAQAIGEKLVKISKKVQVICITHLPQISAMADSHFLIEKNVENERTRTTVRLLTKEERVDEIARTLGGALITDITRENATELINQAEKLKKQ